MLCNNIDCEYNEEEMIVIQKPGTHQIYQEKRNICKAPEEKLKNPNFTKKHNCPPNTYLDNEMSKGIT